MIKNRPKKILQFRHGHVTYRVEEVPHGTYRALRCRAEIGYRGALPEVLREIALDIEARQKLG